MSCNAHVEKPLAFIRSLQIEPLNRKYLPNRNGYELRNGKSKAFGFIRFNTGNSQRTKDMFSAYLYTAFNDPEGRFIDRHKNSNRPEQQRSFHPNDSEDVRYVIRCFREAAANS